MTSREATIVLAALHSFEPFWSADQPERSRVELLAEIRDAIDSVSDKLRTGLPATA